MFRTTFKQFLTRVQFHFHSTSLIDHAQFVAQQQPSRHFTQPPLPQKVLSLRTLSPNVLAAQYAVRGELVLKAEQYQQILKTSPNQLPFKRITYCNIGNPQELGQKPITFFRQVLSLVENPELLKHSNIFPADAIQRAKLLLENISGGTGLCCYEIDFHFDSSLHNHYHSICVCVCESVFVLRFLSSSLHIL